MREIQEGTATLSSIIRKTKRFDFLERTAHFFKTKRTFEGLPLFQKFFGWLTLLFNNKNGVGTQFQRRSFFALSLRSRCVTSAIAL